jgi:hypothetical protein
MYIRKKFERKSNFLDCLDAVDIKYLKIIPPENIAPFYWNYTCFNSSADISCECAL